MTITASISGHFDDAASELTFVQQLAGVCRRTGVSTASVTTQHHGYVNLLTDDLATPGSLEGRAAAEGRELVDEEPEPEPEPERETPGTDEQLAGGGDSGEGRPVSAAEPPSPGDDGGLA